MSKPTENPAEASEETELAEFEYALWHLGAAFSRWRRDCFAAVCDLNLSGTEASILHVIHMNNAPKGLMEISRLLHRDDLPNLQYGLKKLSQLKLIEKRGASRKTTHYVVSELGDSLVTAYKEKRRQTLLRLFRQMPHAPGGLETMVTTMHLMVGMYDQAGDMLLHKPE
ncbi:winged helix DNA-binding protein [Tropicimonas sp. IMCC34011]|uniref:winged helix DNA-binding protein n=1 Tax=Tropicimonas sp. IMCC34011 TaxID=2248759 RepID=UPI000E277321|nr:winged helix DNA-binding protein [Tropicimonas sp. IMCC34011]